MDGHAMPGGTTVSRTGERTISIRTTWQDKGYFTVVLAAMADRKKLKLYVIFKGVRPVAELAKIPRVVVAYSRNGWMNEELMKDWVSRAWGLLNFNQCMTFGMGCIQVPYYHRYCHLTCQTECQDRCQYHPWWSY